MSLDALLTCLENRPGTPVTADALLAVTPKPASVLTCTPVTPVTVENDEMKSAQWCEFEGLLAIVAPAYRATPAEIEEMKDCARSDLENALVCYRGLANQVLA